MGNHTEPPHPIQVEGTGLTVRRSRDHHAAAIRGLATAETSS